MVVEIPGATDSTVPVVRPAWRFSGMGSLPEAWLCANTLNAFGGMLRFMTLVMS